MKKLAYIFTLMLLVAACSGSDDSGNGSGSNGTPDNYNRAAMQTNLADNIIIPRFQDLKTGLETLATVGDTFTATPNQANLDNLRAAFVNAYKDWQLVEPFNIGQAEVLQYSFQMNVYPTTTADIEANIANGTYDLTAVGNNDAVGFPAVDYMLHGIAATDTEILNKYATSNYATYLTDLIAQMNSLTQTVLTDWTTNYRAVFISSTSNTVSSAVNKFINDYIFYYEKGLRANKFGIPSGVFSSGPLADKAEAVYNGTISRDLSIIALDNVQNIFNGKATSTSPTGDGFYNYLIELDRADLAELINTRIDNARQKIQVLNADLKTQVETDNTKMTEAYDALQLVVVSFKVDMLQAFNVSVDYVDADGD
ncbi:imelysin family protein [uncultured Lacinutrix sp.]|uniref:imelysin family protein n=1 Tax=uncultured Lacinutrix sp. TaxID=574032 RepID=UPI00261976EF|nr:imelysin family protein [uncultured Lacinutrix sp.]